MNNVIDIGDELSGASEGCRDAVGQIRDACVQVSGFAPMVLPQALGDGTSAVFVICMRRGFTAQDKRSGADVLKDMLRTLDMGLMLSGFAGIDDAYAMGYVGNQGSADIYPLMPDATGGDLKFDHDRSATNLDDTLKLQAELRMPINRHGPLKLVGKEG